jgi:hypothetical protein
LGKKVICNPPTSSLANEREKSREEKGCNTGQTDQNRPNAINHKEVTKNKKKL